MYRTILLLIAMTGFSSCTFLSVQKRMASFDERFIPVYVAVWQGDFTTAEKKSIALKYAANNLEERLKIYRTGGDDWQEGLRKMTVWIDDAVVSINEKRQERAMVQLDLAKYELMELRRMNQLPYYLDNWFEFHEKMEEVHETASDEQLCLLEWGEFQELVTEFAVSWEEIKSTSIDTNLHPLTQTEKIALEYTFKEITANLAEAQEVLRCGNQLEVAVAMEKLELNFMQGLSLFGKKQSVMIANPSIEFH